MAVTTISTTCPMDCPDTCALDIDVADGVVQRITGAADHSVTDGYICDKVRKFDRRVYHEDRLLYPMRRTGSKGDGVFVRISWDEAIAEITDRFRDIQGRWGGEAILPYNYGGSNGLVSDSLTDDAYFAGLGASRLAKTICAAPATEVATGMYGKMPGVAFEDYPTAKMIIIWGGNPKASNIHLTPFLHAAKRNGAFIAVVDPVSNFSAREADLHVPVYPGADLPVALSMIRLWHRAGQLDKAFLSAHADGLDTLLAQADEWPVERAAAAARVTPEQIVTLAEAYAAASPAVIRTGWGLERNRNGGQAMAAILAMPALLGKFGIRGGGYTMSNSGATSVDASKLFTRKNHRTRVLNMTELGAVLTGEIDPPVKGLFVYNCNPAVTVPDQNTVLRGLAREDLFTVVFEQVMTDTARYADIILPATTFLEHHDIRRAYGNYVVGGVQPVIEARGETRPNHLVFAELGRAMGWTEAPFSWDMDTAMRNMAAALSLNGAPADAGLLTAGKIQRHDFSGGAPVQFETVLPRTPDRKVHLTPHTLGPRPYEYEPVHDDRFPLALISPANNRMISSTLGEFNYPELLMTLHLEDARTRSISDGDAVRVFNDLGEVVCRARVSDRVRAGVVSIPKGAWRKSSRNRLTATALCPATVNIVGGGACFNDARVQVEKMSL